MGYTTLPTITSPTVLTAAQMNAFKTDLDYLKNPREVGTFIGMHSGNIVFNTTSFAYAGNGLDLSFDTSGEPILYNLISGLIVGTLLRTLYIDIEVDGARIGDTTQGLWNYEVYTNTSLLNGGVNPRYTSMQRMLFLGAGSHTIKPMAKMSGAGSGNFSLLQISWARQL